MLPTLWHCPDSTLAHACCHLCTHPPLQVFSKLFENWPTAIAYPNGAADVAAAVRCAVRYKVVVHPRCGGHGNEGALSAAAYGAFYDGCC
jgi:hypothetical protein